MEVKILPLILVCYLRVDKKQNSVVLIGEKNVVLSCFSSQAR